MNIPAKPTIYNGYSFRSRLEARWAVFFDAAGIKYHYEYQDFVLPSGRYLPDFYLPEFEGGSYAEVKPEFDDVATTKCFDLLWETGKTVIFLEGPPDFKAVKYIFPSQKTKSLLWFESLAGGAPFGEPDLDGWDEEKDGWPKSKAELKEWMSIKENGAQWALGLFRADQARYDQRFYTMPEYLVNDIDIHPDYIRHLIGDPFYYGVMAARAAKFEYQ